MAATSDTDAHSVIREKDNYQAQPQSSSEKSDDDATKESFGKVKFPVNIQEPNLSDDGASDSIKEVFDIEAIDPVLSKKMALVNKAIDEIGMTSFQWKMFFLNGFGYAVDSVSRLSSYTPFFKRAHCTNILTRHSFWLFANPLQIRLFNKNTDFPAPTFLEFH
jgi:hypothetical protein